MPSPEQPIRGGDATVKLRNPVTRALLDVVTLGIYGFYWFYVTNRDLAALGRARGTTDLGTNPTNSLLAAFPGILVLVPFVIAGYNTGERVRTAQRISGVGENLNSIVAVVLMVIFFPVAIYYVQTELNKVWERETEGGAGALASGPGEARPAQQQQQEQSQPVSE